MLFRDIFIILAGLAIVFLFLLLVVEIGERKNKLHQKRLAEINRQIPILERENEATQYNMRLLFDLQREKKWLERKLSVASDIAGGTGTGVAN